MGTFHSIAHSVWGTVTYAGFVKCLIFYIEQDFLIWQESEITTFNPWGDGGHVNLGQKAFQRSDSDNQESPIMVSKYVSTRIK